MKNQEIIEFITNVRGGRFFRLRYMTKLPVKAEFSKQGYSIVKLTDTTTRTGVKYQNIAGVQLSAESAPEKPSNWIWKLYSKIKHNTKTDKDYLVIAPIKNSNTTSTYVLTDGNGVSQIIDKDVAVSYCIPSYTNRSSEFSKILTITLDNVLWVG